MFTSADEWWGGRWTGTQFMFYPAALIAIALGNSETMQFFAFALLSLLGLLFFALAFRRTHPEVPASNYLRWIVLFPSLWFWPSAPGKESVIMLGAGIAVLGYCWGRERINWPVLGTGLLLVFAIRPQVAMVFFAALVLAPWLAAGQRWSLRRMVQGVALGAFAVIGMRFATRNLEMSEPGTAGVSSYMQEHGKGVESGGSDFRAAAVSISGLPTALVTVWFRPFPWEAKSVTVLLSVLEVAALWCAILVFRQPVARSLKQWRHDRLLRLAVPFLLFYSVSAGMTMWNLGILARQRILLFPFLFFLLEAVPKRIEAARVRARLVTAPAA
jgi:hypothetical protein